MNKEKQKIPRRFIIMRIAIPVGLILLFTFVAIHYYNVIFEPMIAAETMQ